jgi:hypothetical protein
MNNNVGLLLVVIVLGVVGFLTFNSNISFKSMIRPNQQQQQRDNYVSPFGPKPSLNWEKTWEMERTR